MQRGGEKKKGYDGCNSPGLALARNARLTFLGSLFPVARTSDFPNPGKKKFVRASTGKRPCPACVIKPQ
jgi:hypothetical protein